MTKPAVCSHRNHLQTVSRSKDKAQSRETSRLEENEVYDDKASEEDEKHAFSLRAKQSWKNKPLLLFFLIKPHVTLQGDERVCGAWCGLAVFLARFRGDFYLSLRYCSFSRPSGFRFLTSLVNFDELYVVFYCFSVQFCRFQSPFPP